MSLSEELKKELYKQYFKRPSTLDTNLIDLMVNEISCLEKDFYAPVQKIKYILPNDKTPCRIIKIVPPKRSHSAATLSAVAVVSISFIVLALSHNSQADTHHGFFWWMDKNSSGTSMLTNPDRLSYDNYDIHLNNYELNYSLNEISFVCGMEKQYSIPNGYRFCYKRTYDAIDINVYYSSNLLFLWNYNGHDYYVISDKYNKMLWNVIQNYIDEIKNNE